MRGRTHELVFLVWIFGWLPTFMHLFPQWCRESKVQNDKLTKLQWNQSLSNRRYWNVLVYCADGKWHRTPWDPTPRPRTNAIHKPPAVGVWRKSGQVAVHVPHKAEVYHVERAMAISDDSIFLEEAGITATSLWLVLSDGAHTYISSLLIPEVPKIPKRLLWRCPVSSSWPSCNESKPYQIEDIENSLPNRSTLCELEPVKILIEC